MVLVGRERCAGDGGTVLLLLVVVGNGTLDDVGHLDARG